MTSSSKTQSLPHSVPVIDFSSITNLELESPEWESVRSQVRKALEDYGCFEALFDGASKELRKAMFEASKEAFDLPLETKMSAKSDHRNDGYAAQIPNVPSYEGIGFNGVDNPKVVDNLTLKLWPQGNTTFSKNVRLFSEKLIELDVKVRTMIMMSFGIEKYAREHFDSTTNRFHLFKYNGLEDDSEEKLGLDSHIDRHLLAILCQNDVEDGLEIQTKDGEEWIKAKPSQDSSYLVIAGVSLHVLLNGRVFPPVHRVIITGKKDRYVVGLFLLPKEGIIYAPKEIVDDKHPRMFKPFDYEDYIKFTTASKEKIDLSNLKTYCGKQLL